MKIEKYGKINVFKRISLKIKSIVRNLKRKGFLHIKLPKIEVY